MIERWKDIIGYEGFYQISNYGRVRSLKMWNGICGKYIDRIKILKNTRFNNGYYCVSLKRKKYTVHRLVAEAFIPNSNNYSCINHKDGNKLNNCVSNLEWCSYKHNLREALKLGLYDERNKKLSLCPLRSKRIKMFSLEGNYIMDFPNSVEAEKYLKSKNKDIKINARNIRSVCNGKKGHKTAGGYIWRYYYDRQRYTDNSMAI